MYWLLYNDISTYTDATFSPRPHKMTESLRHDSLVLTSLKPARSRGMKTLSGQRDGDIARTHETMDRHAGQHRLQNNQGCKMHQQQAPRDKNRVCDTASTPCLNQLVEISTQS